MWIGALSEQSRVIWALILREIKTRFGHTRMGYFWGFFEPTMHVIMFILIWKFIGRLGPNGVEPALFLITGVVPFLLIRSTAKQVMSGVKSNKALLVFPQIQLLDFCFARAILELCTYGIIFVAMLVVCDFIGIEVQIENLLGVIYLFFVIWLFSIGLGLFLLPIMSAFPVTNSIYSIVMRIGYFTSGVILSVQQRVPVEYHEHLSWNPMLQLIELFRGAFFYQIKPSEALLDIEYLVLFTLVLWLGGLVLQKRMKRQILEA